MRESVRESRSPAVAALSQAQLTYELEVQRILRDELPAYLHGENTCRDADRAEAASLYGEYSHRLRGAGRAPRAARGALGHRPADELR